MYNSLEMLEEVWYTNSSGTRSQAVEYYYTSEGLLYKSEDLISGKTTVYEYDADGRVVGSSEYDTADMKNNVGIFISYNDKNLVSSISTRLEYSTTQSVERLVSQIGMTYYADGRLNQVRHSATGQYIATSTYTYDYFDRVTRIVTNYGVFSGTVNYSYKTTDGTTSGLVSSYASTVDGTTTSYSYTYDANGNITKIVSGGKETRYVYDNLGQLVREDNGVLNKTYVYTYDDAGNITSKKTYALTAAGTTPTNPTATITYGYSTGTWGDMLTSYNGNSISYDAIGNPLSYYNGTRYTFTWNGRSLKTVTKGTQGFTFTYNDEGIRTSKTVNGVEHTYYLNGTQILAEEWNGNLLVFIYDVSGSPIGMTYRASTYAEGVFDTYWFEKNLQGDIVAVYDDLATKLVTYTYDAWGNQTVTYSNGGATSAAQYNPFRYRGYYYDTETGFYYLNSRYYDPVTGRFISADGYVATGQGIIGNNMYAYCNNNPIIRKDPSGQHWVISLMVTAIFVTCTTAVWDYAKYISSPLPYKTADDAAMAFANDTYSSSSYIRHEYGTIIYSKTVNGVTTYDYATPVVGGPHSVNLGNIKIPFGTTKVATAHTHPNSNSFSGTSHGATTGDIPNAIKRGLDSYVIGPNLNLQKYSFSSNTISVVGTATPGALTNDQRNSLVRQFQVSWDNHLGTCGFGCEYMSWPTP